MTRGLSMRSLANWTRVARIALSSCALAAGGLAHADAPPAGAVPPGWIWQGVWQDGRWSGQWIPGPALPGPAVYPPPRADAETQRMIDRCRDYRHDSVAGGAVIGGVAGAVVGNRLAPGDRVAGTLGGAAVGAVAGAAIERSGQKARDRDCEAFFANHPEFAPGYAPPPPPTPAYGAMPYGAGNYAPAGYMMVPVITVPQAAPVETRTVTTEYIDDTPHRVIRAKPHRKQKRVYNGS